MKYITVTQAAEEAGVSARYIQAEIERGNIKADKLDPTKTTSPYLIDPKSFRDWLNKRAQPEEG